MIGVYELRRKLRETEAKISREKHRIKDRLMELATPEERIRLDNLRAEAKSIKLEIERAQKQEPFFG